MRNVILILALCFTASAQTIIFGGGKAAALVGPNGTTLPASCTGASLFKLTAIDGANAIGFYGCVSGTYTPFGGEGSYTLPTAAADTLGGVKVGTGLTITDGVLAANPTPTTITGASDAVQLRVTGNATQTNPIMVVEKGDGTDILVVNNDGSVDIGTGGGGWLLTAEAAPDTPAAGKGVLYVDSTSKNIAVKDDAGVVKHGVQTKAAVSNQLVSAIDDAGVVTTRALAAGDLPAASTTAVGGVELAIASEVTTGSSSSLAVTPDALRGSDYGKKVFLLEVFEDATALATGDGKLYIPVPDEYSGWNIVAVSAHVGSVVSTSGAVNVDIARCAAVATGIRCSGTVADVLSTNLTVDADEDGSETAAAAAAIDTANDDLPAAGHLRIDVDGAGTGTKGLIVRIVVQKP